MAAARKREEEDESSSSTIELTDFFQSERKRGTPHHFVIFINTSSSTISVLHICHRTKSSRKILALKRKYIPGFMERCMCIAH